MAQWFAPGRRVHLVGHSMGGLVTRELVLSDAASLASWTAMSSGPASIPAHGHTALLQLEAALASAPIEVVWAAKEAMDRAGGWDPPSQEVADFCARRFITNDPAALSDCAEILMTAPDLTEQVAAALDAAMLPAAVVTGEIDDAWPPAVQERHGRAAAACPWHTLPGLGHNPATEDPAADRHRPRTTSSQRSASRARSRRPATAAACDASDHPMVESVHTAGRRPRDGEHRANSAEIAPNRRCGSIAHMGMPVPWRCTRSSRTR